MYEIKKVKVLSLAKISACLGLVSSFIFALIALIPYFLGVFFSPGWASYSGFPLLVLLIIPICTIISFVSGLVLGLVYNFVASHFGGIEMGIVLKEEKKE